MGFLIFGSKKTLDGISLREMKKARRDTEIKYQVLEQKFKSISDRKETNFAAAIRKSSGEKLLAAHYDEMYSRRMELLEAEQQKTLQELKALDGAILVKEREQQFKKSGVWKNLSQMDPDDLEAELVEVVQKGKDDEERVTLIANMFSPTPLQVERERTPGELDFLKRVEEAETAQ
jgi:hypothetical protein